jgi:peptidoglycan/xylan/chitin deacetylase (PgdA/CDA1 family)
VLGIGMRRLIACVAVLAPFTIAPAAGGGAVRRPSAAPAPLSAPVRYRPVGCQYRGPAVAYSHGPRRREVALSFDDGPSPLTVRFVAMLRASHAVATFFMVGRQLGARYRGDLQTELRAGDALGDHTWSHPYLTRVGNVRGELAQTLAAIRGLSGYTPCVFRPPYGAYDASVLRAARALGLASIMWEVDPADYTLPGAGAIAQRVLAQVRPGSIVLSHDGGGPRTQTLQAYPRIIAALRARGYRFVTVPQLLGMRPIYRRCVRQCGQSAIAGSPPRGAVVLPGS